MRISISNDFDRMVRGFQNLDQQQVPFLMASTLTATAKDVQTEEVAEINRVFDRPTPTTQRSIFVQPATKSRWQAVVGIKDFLSNGNPPIKWEEAEIEGGQRRMKRYEKALQLVGAMPPGYYTVPGESVTLDQYGNVPQSLMVQLLSYFKAFPEMGYRANISDKRKASLAKGSKRTGKLGVAYFVAMEGNHLHPGIWARYTFGHGSAVKPILLFVNATSYHRRFEFFKTAQDTIARRFPINLNARWAEVWAEASRTR